MKDVCKECRYAKEKPGQSYYCVKYGIVMGHGKIYCLAFERDTNAEEISEHKD